MIRINVVAEGKSELQFAKKNINEFFGGGIGGRAVIIDSRCIMTSKDKKSDYEYRGGLTSYLKAKNDILAWLKEDSSAYVTTMFDFFRIPTDFPGYDVAFRASTHAKAVEILEQEMKNDILLSLPDMRPGRFIPYIQLHEFEALLYTDLDVLTYDFFEAQDVERIRNLQDQTSMIQPEEINNGPTTAPSKRLLDTVNYRKGDDACEWLRTITMPKIMAVCPHFGAWVDTLASLSPLR